jgi:hypothetical protein
MSLTTTTERPQTAGAPPERPSQVAGQEDTPLSTAAPERPSQTAEGEAVPQVTGKGEVT